MIKNPELVVAYDENHVIGMDNSLPWRGELPADMRHFREITMGQIVVMGRKTFESIGSPLKGRENRILTRTIADVEGGICVSGIREALSVEETDDRSVYVIGGAEVYSACLPYADTVHATEIHASFKGDAIFPTLDERVWTEAERQDHSKDEKNHFDYSFVTYKRKQQFIDVSKARSDKQRQQFEQIDKDGVCPFCSDHLRDYHERPITYENEGWALTENMIPYEGSQKHLLIIAKRHVNYPIECTPEEWVALGEILSRSTEGMTSGGVAFRFGDFNDTAASVAHMHVHVFEVLPGASEQSPTLRFKISRH